VRPPIFKLSLLTKGDSTHTFPSTVQAKADPKALQFASTPSSFDNTLKSIETEINANCNKLTHGGQLNEMLLSLQIQKLQVGHPHLARLTFAGML